MDESTRNNLIAAVWAALDEADEATVRDEVDQAIDVWSP